MRKVSSLSGGLALGVLRRRLAKETFHILSNYHIFDETVIFRWNIPMDELTSGWNGFVVLENARCISNFSHVHALVHIDADFRTGLAVQSTKGSSPFIYFTMNFLRPPHIFTGCAGDVEVKFGEHEMGNIWPLWMKLSKQTVWRIISDIQSW
jgi:hypothetical protein